MSWLSNLFRPKPAPVVQATASTAKERLKVIVAHERGQRSSPDFLPKLEKEITEVIAKYVKIGPNDVTVEFANTGDRSVLELNIIFPEIQAEPLKA